MTVTLTGMNMRWLPKNPPKEARIWDKYRLWRDRCLADYARQTGVTHEIVLDIPWAGIRLRKETLLANRTRAYAWAKAHLDELTQANGRTEVLAELREHYSALMLETASNVGGESN
jgi:hypothetical protein